MGGFVTQKSFVSSLCSSCLELDPAGWKRRWFRWDLGLQHIPLVSPSTRKLCQSSVHPKDFSPGIVGLLFSPGVVVGRQFSPAGKGGNLKFYPKSPNFPHLELRTAAPSPLSWSSSEVAQGFLVLQGQERGLCPVIPSGKSRNSTNSLGIAL